MICRNWGEENAGNHTFCVVCGTDLTPRTVKDTIKSQKQSVEKAAKRLKECLAQPIGGKPASAETEHLTENSSEQNSEENQAILPDFMRNYIR